MKRGAGRSGARAGGLALGGQLDRYVGRLFLASYLTALLLVLGVFLILDMSGRMDRILEPGPDGAAPGPVPILRYYALSLPFLFLQVAPFVTLLAALFTVARLMRNGEVTAVLGAGVSAHRMLLPVLAGGALAALGMFALREWATERLGHERFLLEDLLLEHRPEALLENVWLKDDAGNPVRIGRFHPGGPDGAAARIEDLEIVLHAGDRWLNIEADGALYVPPGAEGSGRRPARGTWRLEGGEREDVDQLDRPPEPIRFLEETDFTPRDVLVANKGHTRPLELSFAEARELAARDPDNVQYRTILQVHLTFPLANVVLLLVGLPFVLRQRRGRGAEGVTAGFLLCVFYYGADFVSRSLGLEGVLSPLMASWLPLLLFGSLGVVLFGSMRS